MLSQILHDWDDERCVRILRNCHAAMGEGACILVVESVIPPGNDPHPAKVMDILMMALTEGRERTEEEFRDLYRWAGLELTQLVPTPSVLSVIEGRRA